MVAKTFQVQYGASERSSRKPGSTHAKRVVILFVFKLMCMACFHNGRPGTEKGVCKCAEAANCWIILAFTNCCTRESGLRLISPGGSDGDNTTFLQHRDAVGNPKRQIAIMRYDQTCGVNLIVKFHDFFGDADR